MAGYFAIFLVCLSLASGLIWLYDAKVSAPKRREKLATAEGSAGGSLDDDSRAKLLQQPALAETAQSIFPVVLAITLFRSFLYEPFQIPSGSMMPTLLIGDFILVEKYAYGVKDPVWRSKLMETGKPEVGDVAVFKYPVDETVDYIKRVIGLPGDTVRYRNKRLWIKPSCERKPDACTEFHPMDRKYVSNSDFTFFGMRLQKFNENLEGVEHQMFINPAMPERVGDYFYNVKKRASATRVKDVVVPEGHYFVMGDNRDNSTDSRFWGFVPEANLVGKAVFIWMSFEFDRDEDSFIPSWIPNGVRFERLGALK